METHKDEKDAILLRNSKKVDAAANHLNADTKGDPDLRQKAMAHADELRSGTKYGVLRCDYEYIPTRGDPGERSSFSSDTNIVKVEGWTFEAVQRGMSENGTYPASEFRLQKADGSTDEYWTKLWKFFPNSSGSAENRSGYVRVEKKIHGDKCIQGYFDEDDYSKGLVYRYEPAVIEQKMKETVKSLEDGGVCGITSDVGYSQAFQANVRQFASVPVVMSSLQQLSFVYAAFDLRPGTKNKIMVMCANSTSFDRDALIPPGVDQEAIKLQAGIHSHDYRRMHLIVHRLKWDLNQCARNANVALEKLKKMGVRFYALFRSAQRCLPIVTD
jgi:hypothetical protein